MATPFPGTEFYKSLKQENLIVERDWTRYDEMHSVFNLKYMSRERLEELATYCHARFWTLDVFIEQTRISVKPGEKVSFDEFSEIILNALKFGWVATADLQTDNLLVHRRICAEAGADLCVEEYTREVGVHNVIEFPSFSLKILGEQKIQCTITVDDTPITSYIITVTASSIESVKAISGRVEDATINLEIDLNILDLSRDNLNSREFLKNSIWENLTFRGIDEIWYRTRFLAAIGVGSTQMFIGQNIRSMDRVGRYAAVMLGAK